MKNLIIPFLSIWTCVASGPVRRGLGDMSAVCVDLGEDVGLQTLRVSKDFERWITLRSATKGACEPDQITTTLTSSQKATRQFCKQFKPKGQRHAFSTIDAPQAATDFLVDHHAQPGKCTKRNVGPDMKMKYVKTLPPVDRNMSPVCVDLGEDVGLQTLRVSKDFKGWLIHRGATRGACEPDQITTTLTSNQKATRKFCRQIKPKGKRNAFSTIEAPQAATDFLLDHQARLGKCTRRNVGPDVKMKYVKTLPPEDHSITIEIKTDDHGNETSWSLEAFPSGDEIASVAVGTYDNNEVYKYSLYFNDGDYLFTIEDSHGDGITGDGYYAIFDKDDNEILRGRSGTFETKTHVLRVGYNPWQDMSGRDKNWLKEHNKRRQGFHEDNNKTYVPLMWSNELKVLAQKTVDHVLQDCDVEELHAEPDIQEGENVFGEKGVGPKNDLDPPEEVLMHWVDQKEGLKYPENIALTQVYWRASKYVGCASGSQAYPDNKYCERHVCMYVTAGNCGMASFRATKRDNWKTPVLQEYSNCGYICPTDGCYVSEFDGQ